jgi:acyl-coenzyme A thioesterase PaaI-like protein
MVVMNFEKYIAHAKKSKFGLFKLNLALGYMIPFNRLHGIKIAELSDDFVRTKIPYKRRNFNHIKGIHACGLATAAEFASGFLLLTKLGSENYRLIMESIEMKYHYQAKKDVYAKFEVTEQWMNKNLFMPLKETDVFFIRCEILLHDIENNHVATGYTNWQIKPWKKVKTQL